MADFLRRHSLLFTAIFLLVVSFQLMSLSMKNKAIAGYGAKAIDKIILPLEKGHYELSQTFKFYWKHYLWLINVESENKELINRVKFLEAQNTRLNEIDLENQRLKTILNFRELSGYQGTVARVIARDPSNWVKTVTINKGSADGLRVGLAVVDGNAILGQIVMVNSNSARILLITDNSSAIASIAQSSRAQGITEGILNPAVLKLRYALKVKELDINIGERILASGIDGVFPKGALVGVVSQVDNSSDDLFQEVEITPSVDISRLEDVFVIFPEASNPRPEFISQVEALVIKSETPVEEPKEKQEKPSKPEKPEKPIKKKTR